VADLFAIQKPGMGLLQGFGVQSMGQGPELLGETVVPVADVRQNYYARQLSIVRTVTAGLTLADQVVTIAVPNGSIWRVIGMGTADTPSAVGAIESNTFFLQFAPLTGNEYTVLASTPPRATLANETRVDFGFYFPEPMILLPGTNLQSALTTNVGGALTISRSFRVLYQDLTAP
jgi:hypothetical protein